MDKRRPFAGKARTISSSTTTATCGRYRGLVSPVADSLPHPVPVAAEAGIMLTASRSTSLKVRALELVKQSVQKFERSNFPRPVIRPGHKPETSDAPTKQTTP